MSEAQDYFSILHSAQTLTAEKRLELARALLSSLQRDLRVPRPGKAARRALGFLAGEAGELSDERVEEILSEERMKKYGL